MTTFEGNSRPSFRERVQALAGHSTYREPAQGGGGMQPIPTDHLVCTMLAFGRDGPHDMGPDIAIDIATGRPGHWQRVCEWLGKELAQDRSRAAQRLKPWAGHVALFAYNATVRGYECPPAPAGVSPKDWGECLLFCCLLLQYSADDALDRAAYRARKTA